MARGRKPAPAAIKKAKGNPGKRKIGEDPKVSETSVSTKSQSSILSYPDWLDDDGQKVWDKLAPNLFALKLLTATDFETFGRYCENFSTWLKLRTILKTVGLIYTVETASGTVSRAHPAFLMAERLDRLLTTFEADFGLNPAERQRIFAARAVHPPGDLFNSKSSTDESKAVEEKPVNEETKIHGFLN
ncbi:phage terminase small subunit P27 family [Lentilitoribacter sp. EG35]|uniref:phage terminase small subunit P27 family n=1 Tax=Lentilitoribacter sp. EG35 TaxID=3234192 RepID=UPI003460C499